MWNRPCMNAWKETVLHRAVPRHRVNEKPIRTSTERFHTEPFQSPRVNAALVAGISYLKSLLVLQNFTIARKSGDIALAY